MDKGYQFVDGTSTDRATKRLIRSHAMRGTNAGRRLQRPSKLPKPKSLDRRQQSCSSLTATRPDPFLASIDRRSLVTLTPPFALAAHSLRVINEFFTNVTDRLYPLRFGLSFTESKLMWLRVLLTDEAACHCAIAAMAACNDFFYSGGGGNSTQSSSNSSSKETSADIITSPSSSPAGLYHLGQALALINERLASDHALSDSSLGIVVMLIIQEQIRHRHAVAAVHFDGLCRMVSLRGGLGRLERNIPLLLKICKMDISYSLTYGRPLVFSCDLIADAKPLLLSTKKTSGPTPRGCHTSPLQTGRLDPFLANVVEDVTNFTALLSDAQASDTRTMIDAITFQKIATSVFSRLIRFHLLQRCSGRDVVAVEEAACHIGLTLYMITVCLQFDCRRVVEYKLVSERLRSVLCSSGGSTTNNDRTPELDGGLVLWLLFIGGIWACGGEDEGEIAWYVSQIGILTSKLGYLCWEEAHIVASAFPWLKAVHDDKARVLWDMAH